MTVTITSRNVNGAFADAWWRLRDGGVNEQSRNGPVRVMMEPVITTYLRPNERVLFDARRDANPVFHLVESLWMLAGRDDVIALLPFNSGYGQFAEPNGRVWGAYGARWRDTFGVDQVLKIIELLRADPTTRQAVMQMWEVNLDLGAKVKDKPCNTHIYFDARHGLLNMTVCCRSNDMLWGAYGANVVHFSMLQELIAWACDLAIGEYRQFSNNFHVYTDLPMVKDFMESPPYYDEADGPYATGVLPTPMFRGGETVDQFIADCEDLFTKPQIVPRTQFFRETVIPLVNAYIARKQGDTLVIPVSEYDWVQGYRAWAKRRDNVS